MTLKTLNPLFVPALTLAACFGGLVSIPAHAEPLKSSIVSLTADSQLPNLDCWDPSISDDGRFLAFTSLATNFGFRGNEASSNVYLKDLKTGEVVCVSRPPAGDGGEAGGASPHISADGRFVLFSSGYPLLPQDTNDVNDLYLYERETGALELISRNRLGKAGNAVSYDGALSADGRFVLFSSDAEDLAKDDEMDEGSTDYYVLDRKSGKTEPLSRGSGARGVGGYFDRISQDGRYATFTVYGTTPGVLDPSLSPSPGEEERAFLFLQDRATGLNQMITRNAALPDLAADGTNSEAAWMSADGGVVLVSSTALDLVDPPLVVTGAQLYRYTASTGVFDLLTSDESGRPLAGSYCCGCLDEQQRFLLFSEGDGLLRIKNLESGEIRQVFEDSEGTTAYFAMTGDGRNIVFDLYPSEQSGNESLGRQVYLRANPFLEGSMTRPNPGNEQTEVKPHVSPD